MIRGRAVLWLTMAAALSIAAPALADGVTITAKDAGKTISVVSGQPLIVKLPGIRGKGVWRLDTDPTPELILSGRVTDSVAAPDAPETTVYSFATRAPGTVALKASYVGVAAGNSFAVLVTVTKP
jgi:hypothetical protein